MSQSRVKKLDQVLSKLTLALLSLAVLMTFLTKNQAPVSWLTYLLIGLVILLLILSFVRQWLLYPKPTSETQPILLPKVKGDGYAINPHHPFGIFLYLLICIILVCGLFFTLVKK